MPKLTPEQAFSHAKALWPDVTKIEIDVANPDLVAVVTPGSKYFVKTYVAIGSNIEWPKGVSHWPIPGQWRDATIADIDKGMKARVRDDAKAHWLDNYENQEYVFVGAQHLPAYKRMSWITWRSGSVLGWVYCQVWDESL